MIKGLRVLTKALGTLQPSIDLQQRLLAPTAIRLKRQELKTPSHSWRLERFKCISGQVITQAFLTRNARPIDFSLSDTGRGPC